PPGLAIDLQAIAHQLARRRPGQSPLTTQRQEADELEILSGVFEGETTGTPIGFLIRNSDARSKDYSHLKDSFRPGHADYTYTKKYGRRDYHGGGRASARETACRVVGGAIAEQLLQQHGISAPIAWVQHIHRHRLPTDIVPANRREVDRYLTRCPDPATDSAMTTAIEQARAQGDSLGGVVACRVQTLPAGLGEPVFDKLTARLAAAMMSLPATRGFEIGMGFSATQLTGSEHNDALSANSESDFASNRAGGVLGGISNGMPLVFRVAFKPTSTIASPQGSINAEGEAVNVEGKGRHDPCVLPRAVPIVEAMTSLVLADLLLSQAANKLV
ncbi:MAG: chorismate synthase, partial [Bacteroidota bacterium]